MHRMSASAIVLLALGVPVMAGAQVVKVGSEFQVNSFTSNDQENPRVAADASGNFVVVWTSRSVDGSGDGVSVQRFTSAGTKLGTEFVANTYTTNDQSVPQVAVQPNGNFVVVWQSDNNQDGDDDGIFGQRFDSTGAQVGTEFQVNTFTSGHQENPAVAVDPAGDFVVVWEGPYAGDHAIFGQRFDSTGATVGTEFIASTVGHRLKEKAQVAMDATGNFTVVWENHDFDGSGEGVAAQRYDNTGAPVGTEFQVNTYTTDDQEHTAIAMDAAGNFIVVWDSYGQDGSKEGIFGQRFDSSGARVGTEFQANTYTTNEQEDPSVAMDAAGNFVVTWYSGCGDYGSGYGGSCAGQDGNDDGAFGQRFSSTGARLGTEFQINTYTTDNQTDPKVAMQPRGNFVVVWQSYGQDGSGEGIFAQRLGPAQVPAPAVGSTSLALLAVGLLLIGATTLARRRQRRA
jgi:hypothetical protein